MKTLYLLPILFIPLMPLIGCEEAITNQQKSTSEFPEIKLKEALSGWTISTTDLDFEINVRDLHFVDAETGFMAGYHGDIFKTTNGGQSWQKLNTGTGLHLFSIQFLDQNIGFAAGAAINCLSEDCGKGSVLLKTTNGGNTWTKIFFEEYSGIHNLTFFDESSGLALLNTPNALGSNNISLAKTSDGGNKWQFLDMGIRPHPLPEIFLVDGIVYIIGSNQRIYKSSDRGQNWETIQIPMPDGEEAQRLYFYNEQIGYVAGPNSVYKTTDGGAHWKLLDTLFPTFGLIHFYNENQGFSMHPVFVYNGDDFPSFLGSNINQSLNGDNSWQETGFVRSFNPGPNHFPYRHLGYSCNGKVFYSLKKQN